MSSAQSNNLHTPEKPLSTRHLFRSSFMVSVMTQISRILGMARDIVLANAIGAGHTPGADAFFLAFRIPQFLRRLFAEGAFQQAFVPVLAEYRARGNQQAVRDLINHIAGVLGGTSLAISVLVVIASPWFTVLFAPGFWLHDPERFGLTSELLRITFPYLFLITMTGFASSVLNAYDRFAVAAATPILMNVTLIIAAVVAVPWFEQPVFAMAWGVLISGVVQLVFQLPSMQKIHLMPIPRWHWKHEGVQRVLKLMVPALFGVSVSQINLMMDSILASFLPTGSVAWLYYSERVSELPLGIFGVAIATVILPSLSRSHISASPREFSATLDWAIRLNVLIGLPAALALIVLATPILSTLFEHGETTAHDIAMSAWAMRAYAVGLIGFMMIKILAPGFYSRQDMKTPVRIAVISVVAAQIMNVSFMWVFDKTLNMGHLGLALATALAAYINSGLLFRALRKQGIYRYAQGWGRFIVQVVAANGSMVLLLCALSYKWSDWSVYAWQWRIIYLTIMCSAGVAIYALTLLITGLRVSHLRLQV
ncbi:MAG TPA: murein biosynthesis integral membrane protein MurJ [Pseudomonadales bacterium]|nr:murein biosynthesis integral membrane protein MurJ [Pseudomonadales bacterium]HNL91440.1 murein biosynthesis integral membrane protein MurJ [Pseudomonadales bacterium]HNN87327.1 murein biosynthesis integral membrane protein MurJ [Pseudomonadales bacterium]